MFRTTLALVAIVVASLFTTTALAEQDIIILDPGNGTWAEKDGIPVPGPAHVYRSDLFSVASPNQRRICYKVGSTAVRANALRYRIQRANGDIDTVEIEDTSSTAGSGLTVKWNGYLAGATMCPYAGCPFSGMPPEVYGDIIYNAVEVRVGTSWSFTRNPIQLQFGTTETCATY